MMQQQVMRSSRGAAAPTGTASTSRPAAAVRPCRGLPQLTRPRTIVRFREENGTGTEVSSRTDDFAIQKEKEANRADAVKDAIGKAPDSLGEAKRAVDISLQGPKGYFSPVTVPFWMPAFTRRRELFIGRAAMIGIAATCFFEITTQGHLGPIGQLSAFTGLDNQQIFSLYLAIAAYNGLALTQLSATFSPQNQKDIARRPMGPPQGATVINIMQFLGITGFGFTKHNEIYNGRLAMLGFAAAVLAEARNGHGMLAEVGTWLGMVPNDAFFAGAAIKGLVLLTGGILLISGLWGSPLPSSPDEERDMY